MSKLEIFECCEKTFKTEENYKKHRKEEHRELPMWCRGIMGGCVNCGGCI